ncbi:hypothetical protein [Pararhodospirillum photometricum]|uniref:hypothetical protein n=1 Tax=Pararhodospirillum photometricum TaxID=1084 RepID=UPI0012FE9837|nr:hypothetical protein [Pararhodospirillum photometricum]
MKSSFVLVVLLTLSACTHLNRAPVQPLAETNIAQQKDEVAESSIDLVRTMSSYVGTYLKNNSDKKIISDAIDRVRRDMKDPESVKFKDVSIVGFEDGKVVCGKYNAKNSYGAYVGYNKFVSDGVIVSFYENKISDVQNSINAGIIAACGH